MDRFNSQKRRTENKMQISYVLFDVYNYFDSM